MLVWRTHVCWVQREYRDDIVLKRHSNPLGKWVCSGPVEVGVSLLDLSHLHSVRQGEDRFAGH